MCKYLYIVALLFRENDLDEIAKEAGIDLPQENNIESDITFPAKKEKKKKKDKIQEKE